MLDINRDFMCEVSELCISIFRWDVGTTFELTENSKWHRHTSRAVSHKEHYWENRILVSLFVNERNTIIENSKCAPVGHLVFWINMYFSYDQLDTKGILHVCVKCHNSYTWFDSVEMRKYGRTDGRTSDNMWWYMYQIEGELRDRSTLIRILGRCIFCFFFKISIDPAGPTEKKLHAQSHDNVKKN